MSLFGDEAETPSTRPKASLFDEGNAKTSAAGGSSMFGDDAMAETHDSDSPWGFTPKKSAGRGGSLVKTLLADADVPDGYVDVFDRLQAGGGKVEAAECQKLLGEAGIAQGDREQAWRIVSGEGSSDLGRGEFNVLLALVGLAQEGEELSLDAVDERRRNLPMPSLPALASLKKGEEPPAAPRQSQARGGAGQETTTASVQQNGHARKTSFGAGFGENDPWASPDLHKGHGHLNGLAGSGPQRTTSSFTTGAASTTAGGTYGNGQAGQGDEGEASSWGSTPHFGGAGGGNEGFGGTGSGAGGGFGDDPNTPSTPRRPAAPRNTVSKGAEEVVTVQILDGKEGMFMFQHRNYEVASVRRNSKVVRRYSDFVWLLDCLHKRYPFRQLPLLPPKRVAINGNHIAADQTFLEKRRRGLARFCNALVRHPVLREEQLVVMFLTVPTELTVWRKQATISVQEEFASKPLPPHLEDSLPPNLSETLLTVRAGVRRSADLYINLCSLVERLCKRREALAAENSRFALNLLSLTECTADAYALDAHDDVPLLNEGLSAISRHVGLSRELTEAETRAWDEGFLEDLKTLRDGLVSLRDVFDRRERFARDNIPALEKRIAGNETKLQGVKAKGDAAKPGEAERVEGAIVSDKESIVAQHARGVLIKECLRDELRVFSASQGQVSRAVQEWAQERVKFAELQGGCWRGAVEALEGMPGGD
ncbi:hypothetical protein B0A50_03724 [Salinomyces thailandicus]|uniref:Sorting nexin MVP1 n=1 Tax=Salinomyces thailandicus TaxID=706561 RepID=A0A4U0U344_9PEZI|nr:hypothetical protein B0A50_03724 [Salinomyces thailandica]